MGIKFYCPNGHKVNVKSFLAGKKGLCPKCGVRVDIPWQSAASDRSIASPQAASVDDPDELVEQISSAHTIPSTTPTLSLTEDQSPFEDPRLTPGFALAAGPAVSQPTNGALTPSQNILDDRTVSADDALLPPGSNSGPRHQSNAFWHVQFSTGQQVGPLDDTILQQWMAEGRISPDNLIWREGWSQWQSAMAVFPHWRNAQNPANSLSGVHPRNPADDPLLEAVQNSLPVASTGNWLRQRHRGKREIRARLSLVLLGLVILLFALLMYVFFMREQPSEPKQTSLSTNKVMAKPLCMPVASMLA